MKKAIFISLLVGALVGVSWAEFEWPGQHTVVRINGEVVTATWKDGKPYVFRQQTLHLLHVRTGPDEIDLARVLEEQGFRMTLNEDGSIDCNKTQSLAVEGPPPGYSYNTPATTPSRSSRKSNSRNFSRGKHKYNGTAGMVQTQNSGSHIDISASRALVESIGQELAVQCKRPTPWTFTIVEKSEPNAWTPGEGKVFVTTGLLKLQLTKDEIAGILGHEIAHGARQHLPQQRLQIAREDKADRDAVAAQQRAARAKAEYERAMRQEENPNSLGALNAKEKYEWEMHRARGEMRQVNRQDAFNKSYRDHETVFNHAFEKEADAVGLGYCIAAGYRADGLLTALQKLLAHNYKNYGAQALEGGKSHPPIGERIARQQELLSQKGY
ncbi:MAG: M48 family metallopeptidase [Candidatus Eremiobacteraeota bacterium]|nr:M48 family metallopeptidase [Candidatus Eremiobacteraeota bacterium]MCW5869607.1 M48 family metallopeptidase [Candidatus Eremiobacteraeota bacterium]